MSTNHDREQAGPAGGDAAVTRAWRQASYEQPPARLDAAILDAARRSVEAEDAGATTRRVEQRTRIRWMQWQPLAAAATVAGLAFVLLQTLPREREVAPPIRMQVPLNTQSPEPEVAPAVRGGTAPGAPAPSASRESRRSGPASVATEAPAELDSVPLPDEGSDAGADGSPRAEAASDIVDTMRSAEADERKGEMTGASGEAYSQKAAPPGAERSVTQPLATPAPPSAEDWAARIEALHASGDLAAAAAALREFRAVDRDADSSLPESLRDWARTVQ